MTERLLDQYQDSPNVINFIDAFTDVTDLESAFNALQNRLSIDLMEGVNLDRIGFIVGQPRPYISTDDDESFAFDGAGGLGFNEGVWRSSSYQPNVGNPVSDVEYRQFLKAAILRNYSNGSMPDIVRFIDLALGKQPIVLNRLGELGVVNGVGFIQLNFSGRLTTFEAKLLRENLPVAAGIGIDLNDNVPLETLALDYREQTYYVGDAL